MALKAAGDFSGRLGSMAATLDDEFSRLWSDLHREAYGDEWELPEEWAEERRMFCSALARGVLMYLKEMEDEHDEHFLRYIDHHPYPWHWFHPNRHVVTDVTWNVEDGA